MAGSLGTSLLHAYIRHATGDFGDGDPCDAALARDVLFNNPMHIADECGQVRIAWTAGTSTSYLEAGTPPSTSAWNKVTGFGPFPLTISADGESYALRVRMSGYNSKASTTIEWRAVLCTPTQSRRDLELNGDNVANFTTTTTTDGAVDAATDNVILMSRAQVTEAIASFDTLAALGGGPATIDWCWVMLDIYAKTNDVTSLPRLTGVYAAEYVGSVVM